MSDKDTSRRSVLKKVAGTASIAPVALAGQSKASSDPAPGTKLSDLPIDADAEDVETEIWICEGTKNCTDNGECDCFHQCKCSYGYLLKRECCCCDGDDEIVDQQCTDWEYVANCY